MVNNVNIINNPSLESFHQCQNWPEAHPLGHTTACREGRTMLPESDMIIMAGCGGGHLEAEHEGDPLVVGGVRGLVSRHHALLLHDALEVGLEQHGDNLYTWGGAGTWYLVLWRDVGAAVDPAVVIRHLGVNTMELTAKTSYE